MSKYADQTYQFIGNQINNGCNCNAGGNIYKVIHGALDYNGYGQRKAW